MWLIKQPAWINIEIPVWLMGMFHMEAILELLWSDFQQVLNLNSTILELQCSFVAG